MGKSLLIFALIFIAIFFIFGRKNTSEALPISSTKISLGKTVYTLELARTNEERALGLSGRTSLCPTCGMLFIFDKEGIYPFWMKDTLIPLDMIWLDSKGKIVTIHTAQPQPGAAAWELKTYPNSSPARYVIELNAGDFTKNNLKIGDTIIL